MAKGYSLARMHYAHSSAHLLPLLWYYYYLAIKTDCDGRGDQLDDERDEKVDNNNMEHHKNSFVCVFFTPQILLAGPSLLAPAAGRRRLRTATSSKTVPIVESGSARTSTSTWPASSPSGARRDGKEDW